MDERIATRKATKEPVADPVLLAASEAPAIRTEALHFATDGPEEFWDLTEFVRDVVARSKVSHGQVTVYTPHTTTSIVINDFRKVISSMVPANSYYEHDDHELRTENLQEDEYVNGHAHCRQLLVGQPSVTVPIVDGEMILGQWQRILFVELDQARKRRVFFHAQGI
jgi:secondary thiamine-phosphate synthase enzyme